MKRRKSINWWFVIDIYLSENPQQLFLRSLENSKDEVLVTAFYQKSAEL